MRKEGAALESELESSVFDAVAVCAGAQLVLRLLSWANDLIIPSLHSSESLLKKEDESFDSVFANKAVVNVGLHCRLRPMPRRSESPSATRIVPATSHPDILVQRLRILLQTDG